MKNRVKFDKVQLLILLQLLLCVCIIIFTVMKKSNIVSLCFTSTFILLIIILFILIIENKLSRIEMSNLLLLYLIIIISFAGVSYGSNTLSFSYYRKLIIFYSTIIFLFIISKIRISKKVIDLVIGINVVVGIIYITNYYLGVGATSYYLGGLTFNFSNPNLASIWLVHTCLYSILAALYYRSKVTKFISFIVACFMTYFVSETMARTGLITIVVFIALLILINIRKRIKLSKSIITLIVWSPFIVACIYMISIETGFIEKLSFLEFEGKSLYSRHSVWTHAFNELKSRPFMGNYFGISNGIGMSQMHNTHIDILASYGIIVFLLVMIYITRLTTYINSKVCNKFQVMSLIAFLSIIVMGFGEAALFSGGVGMYILTGMFLVLARYNEQS